MPLPIDPSLATGGAEWQIAPPQPVAPAQGTGTSFAQELGSAIQSVQTDQQAATDAVQGMVTGADADPTQAVMALERARLSMQLAAQIRTKAVEAFQDVFHTQI
jgi:flagellar hook-basal body complex protein FliE